MNRFFQLTLISLILFGLVGCQRGQVPGDVEPTVEAEAAAPEVAPTTAPPVGTTILADGQIVAVTPVLVLSFEANGRLLQLNVQPGDQVSAGDVIGTLDDGSLQDAVTNADLQVAQAETSLAQAQLSLDNLLTWAPDETAVALAEANLAAAQAGLDNAQTSDSVAGYSVTSARLAVEQAERQLADAQSAYETAFDPGRDWEQYIDEPICFEGQGGPVPCTGPFFSTRIENERKNAPLQVQAAQDNLEAARAQYNLAVAGVNQDTAVSANASVISAQQALDQANTGPKKSEIDAARLQVEQAELSLEQSQFSLQQAQDALKKAQLMAPWSGIVLSVDVAAGAMVSAGMPIITLLDMNNLQFHTSNLSERDLAQISLGQPVKIVLKSFPNEPITGTVAGVAPQATGTVGDAAVFAVKINLDPSGQDLRPGMTGRAEITNESG